MTFNITYTQLLVVSVLLTIIKAVWSGIDAGVKKLRAPNKEQDVRIDENADALRNLEKRVAALEAEANDTREAVNLMLSAQLETMKDCPTKAKINDYLINRRVTL